jgi:transcriptional regulator with XRE-family HTH domain
MWHVDTFGKRFKAARERAGLSPLDIAAVCTNKKGKQLSRQSVHYWETDEEKPTYANFLASLQLMKASADEIMGLKPMSDRPTLVDGQHLAKLVKIFEQHIHAVSTRRPIKPERRAEIITRLYSTFPPGQKLVVAHVVKFIRDEVAAKGVSHGKGNRRSD